jgi:hypothetical protein
VTAVLQSTATSTSRRGKLSDLLGWSKVVGAEVTGVKGEEV